MLRSPLLVNNVKEDYKQLLSETKPDVIIMTLWYWQADKPWFNVPGLFMTYTRKALPTTKIIIVSDDVHWLRLQMLSAYRITSEGHSKTAMSPEAMISAVRLSEYQNYAAADAVVSISLTDKDSILKHDSERVLAKSNKIFVVPFVASPWYLIIHSNEISEYELSLYSKIYSAFYRETQGLTTIKPFGIRSGLIFVGNMKNPTNTEGLKWFLENVMPELSKRDPDMKVTIVGGGGWTVSGVAPVSPIRYVGWLSWEQMRQELDSARVFISPIVVSTGVNTKNALAMSNGVPLVTTKLGAAGLCKRCDDNPVSIDVAFDSSGLGGLQLEDSVECPFITAGDVTEFVRAVMQLYRDELLWNKYSLVSANTVD